MTWTDYNEILFAVPLTKLRIICKCLHASVNIIMELQFDQINDPNGNKIKERVPFVKHTIRELNFVGIYFHGFRGLLEKI